MFCNPIRFHNMNHKLIIISAPSGTGKSTIIGRIIDDPELRLSFSVSTTTRAPREGEQDGVDYYFISEDEFRTHIENDDFVEYEQVYAGRFYGTLKSEIARILDSGRNVILDIDCKGGINVKRLYGDDALAVFIAPPDLETLRRRLENRGTDSAEEIDRRVGKAAEEMRHAKFFDYLVVNDDLDSTVEQVRNLISDHVNDVLEEE